jgi:hypothetical protein
MDKKELVRDIVERNLAGCRCQYSTIYHVDNVLTEVTDDEHVDSGCLALCNLTTKIKEELQRDGSVVCPWFMHDGYTVESESQQRCGNSYSLNLAKGGLYEKLVLPMIDKFLD